MDSEHLSLFYKSETEEKRKGKGKKTRQTAHIGYSYLFTTEWKKERGAREYLSSNLLE